MHLTLKKETTQPAASNFLQQRAMFEDFIDIFDNQRPHEALDMKCPAEAYHPPPALPGTVQYRLSLPRQNRGRHRLRSDLFRSQKD